MADRPGLIQRLLAGADQRRTRLHDELGQRVPASRMVRNLPRALAGGLVRVIAGKLPPRPWISYDAQAEIAAFLTSRQARVLEFGSGQSTLWYAQRAASLVSLETDPAWHRQVTQQLAGTDNVSYRFAGERDAYANPAIEGLFDFIMIDGAWREDCARFALAHLAPGGIIYLDNSDKGPADFTGDIPAARALLIAHAEAHGWQWREFTDFAPAQFFVQRGLMVRAA